MQGDKVGTTADCVIDCAQTYARLLAVHSVFNAQIHTCVNLVGKECELLIT